MTKVLHKIIEEQIKTWEADNILKTPRTPKGNPFPVITISREFGALGAALAKYMGARLGFCTWDKEILQAIADKLGSDKKYLETLDENRRETIEDVVVGFLKSSTNTGYIRTLNQVVRTLEEHGNAIIVGRAANYICTDPKAFHLRVVSPLSVRTRHIAEQQSISKTEAQALITKKDQERAGFSHHHFKKDVANAADYDLILNSSVYTLDEMMEIVMLAYEKKTGLKLRLQ
ncbi:MAG: cytidylate kinase-like family protein [Balneolaceae bacterium]|nr:MAG: cytidylate kinase-like family protein [Balneolaceae bacterium]